jgi:hypothetical protein
VRNRLKSQTETLLIFVEKPSQQVDKFAKTKTENQTKFSSPMCNAMNPFCQTEPKTERMEKNSQKAWKKLLYFTHLPLF